MSSALAIAGVSLLLRKRLSDGLSAWFSDVQELNALLGGYPTISIGPPDRVVADNGNDPSQINLFLYQVSSNQGWRNQDLPSRDTTGGQRLSNPPLGIDLHYLISAYGSVELHAETLLGYAMQCLHETPVLSRAAIRHAAANSSDEKTRVVLNAAKLDVQVEQLRITPEYLSTEEMSKIWTALQTHYRPTVAYRVSVILIQSNEPIRAPLPVLTRGRPTLGARRDPGVLVSPGLVPPVPTLESVRPSNGESTAEMGETIELFGHHLDGSDHAVTLSNDRLDVLRSLSATVITDADGRTERLEFAIPPDPVIDAEADFPVGVYRIEVQLTPPGESIPRVTNQLALAIAPSITELPPSPIHPNALGTASFKLRCAPAVRLGQNVLLFLGQHAYLPKTIATGVSELEFDIPDAPLGNHLARLRVDGIDSPIIDRTAEPPAFLNTRIRIESP
jgi:hypothetical protein